MGLFEFMAPQWASAEHMQELASSMRRQSRRSNMQSSAKLKACEDDIGFLGLMMFALVRKLIDNGTLSPDDLSSAFAELDGMDGAKDGKIDLKILQGALGIERPAPKRRVVRRKPRSSGKVKLRTDL